MLKVFNAFSGHSRYFLFGVNRASFHLQRTPLRGFARIRTARGAAAFPSDALPIDDSQKVRIVDEGSEKYKIIELNSQQAEEFDRMLGMPSPGVKRATKKTGAKDTPHKSASKDLSFAFKSRPAATPSDLGEAVAEMASSRGSTSWDGGSGNSEEEWKKIKGFLELNPYICHGCGAPFQSKTPDAPGFLPKEKMAPHRVNAEAIRKEQDTIKLIRDAGYEVGSDAANNLLLNANTPTEVIDRISQRFSKSRKGNSSAVSAVSVPEEVVDIRAAKSQYKEDIGDVACTCQRCFRLQQYGQIEDSLRPGWSENELLTPEHFESVLKVINQTKAVVVCLVDIFDLKGSILTNLKQIAGKNPIVIAANKVDLLPSDVSKVRIRDRIYDMIREECDLMSPKEAEEKKYHAMKQRGWIRPNELKSEAYVLYRQNVHLVSCESGVGMNELMKGIFSLAQDHGNKIYVMGAANVGKSSFINRILNMNVGGRGGSGNKKAQKPVSIRDKWEPTATVSNLPGTTLNFLKIVMHNGITVFDTPGLMNKGQLTALLTAKELNDVIPDKPVHPVTLRLDEGRCALIGGIAKIEMIQVRLLLM